MFIKIIHTKPEHVEYGYECHRYKVRFFNLDSETQSEKRCMISMESDDRPGSIHVELEMRNVTVYFMNEKGHTIDKMDWLYDDEVEAVPVPA